jgi:hypothetical protein
MQQPRARDPPRACRRHATRASRPDQAESSQQAMTDLLSTDRTRLLPASGVGGCLREGVARWHGCRRNWARTTPQTTTTNQPRHQPQRWVEKVGRSITNSETPQPQPPNPIFRTKLLVSPSPRASTFAHDRWPRPRPRCHRCRSASTTLRLVTGSAPAVGGSVRGDGTRATCATDRDRDRSDRQAGRARGGAEIRYGNVSIRCGAWA